MSGMEPYADVIAQYTAFATQAADSPCFAAWAASVAADPELVAWLSGLPSLKQQPNLVFAAARWHGVPAPGPYAGLRAALLGDDGRIRATILERSTQTNEAGRLATLVPVFARIEGPVALLEVGASAGLCLYPDRYSYAWRTEDGTHTLGSGPVLECDVEGNFTAPTSSPQVEWRGGIDLNPLDVTDEDQMAWLTTLVWPEQDERRTRLRAAIEVARTDPPRITPGNLLTELPMRVEEAAAYGTVVVFHSAVIAYLEGPDRRVFHRLMTDLVADGRCRWVSNEGRGVLPEVTATGPEVSDDALPFVLGLDGRALAWTHGHGRSMTWL